MKISNLSIHNATIYYEEHGQPREAGYPILIMVHGYLSSTFSFRKLIPYLEKHYTIFALDLPGFGQSEKSKTFVYTMSNYGKIIVEFIKKLNVDQVGLVGHSMGGQLCLQAANLAPKMINKLVLFNASGYLGPVRKSLIYATYLPFFRFILRKYFEKKDVVKNFLDVVHDHSLVDHEMMQGYLKPIKEPDFYHSLIRLIRHREGDLTSEDLKKIEHDTLLIWGREDKIVPLSVGEQLTKDLPNARLKIYDQTGHLVPEERPSNIALDILDFIPVQSRP